MRSMGTVASAITVAATMIGASSTAPPARASTDGPAINGTYRATSVGEWAKTNQSFHDEPTVSSTWTVSSSCATAQDCTGRVTSDQGWSAPLYMHDGVMWTVKHEVPNWEHAPTAPRSPECRHSPSIRQGRTAPSRPGRRHSRAKTRRSGPAAHAVSTSGSSS